MRKPSRHDRPEAVCHHRLIANLLLGEAEGKRAPTPSEWMELLRSGLPRSTIGRVAAAMGVTSRRLMTILGFRSRTGGRARALRRGESDRLFRVARMEVLGSRQKARAWLQLENRALDGAVPLALFDTAMGEEQVLDALDRIDQGIYG